MGWRIGEILIREKWITWEQLEDALREQEKTAEQVGDILLRKGYIYPSVLYRALARQSNMNFIDLKRTRINAQAVERVPRSIAAKFTIMPVEYRDGILTLAIPSPTHLWPEEEIKELGHLLEVKTVLSREEEIQEAIELNYGPQEESS